MNNWRFATIPEVQFFVVDYFEGNKTDIDEWINIFRESFVSNTSCIYSNKKVCENYN